MLSSDFHCMVNDGTIGAAQKKLRDEVSQDMLAPTSWTPESLVTSPGCTGTTRKPNSSRHFPYNENPTRALNTTSFKCCLLSTDDIDRREKNSRMRIKVQGQFVQEHFLNARALRWNPPDFCKKIRSDTFLTEYIYSLLIEKYLCECRNISVKFLCVFLV